MNSEWRIANSETRQTAPTQRAAHGARLSVAIRYSLFAIPCYSLFAICLTAPARADNLQFTYLWHLEQPIYWPDQQAGGADRYERAWESIQRRDGGALHPADDLRTIFGISDRVAAYQARPRDCINDIRWTPRGGAQMSYSGGLIENIAGLGAAGQLGYSSTWYAANREARGWTNTGGKPRLDIVLFSFHHALLPLCDDSAVRKEIQLYKEIYGDAWTLTPGRSRGFFPSEMAFSERLIPILAHEGVAWAVVSNEHISRACANFPVVYGTGGINCDPPNRADQLNPAQADWLRITIQRGCSPANAYPYAYTPHWARYMDPETGVESRIIVVPADQALGWLDGYAPLGLEHFQTLQQRNPPDRPQLVLMAHDGDNAWGGGFSYYREAVPNFVSSATAAGFGATTIEQYLADYPVPADDVVHVEDGAWVNAEGDFGAPGFLNWNWPLLDAGGQIDPVSGWHVDARNWAVITAAQNRVDTAEQIAGGVNLRKILYPDAATTPAERAWHYFLGALNSGFMYYGTALDHEVKPTVACNEAVSHADAVIGDGSQDATPPTIWIPQRQPWNPGSVNFGPQYGYQQVGSNGDFHVWTFIYDVSGVASATLRYRVDADAVLTDANRIYAGGAGVGAWVDLPLARRVFPAGNVYNNPGIDFFEMPRYIAEHFSAQIVGVREQLVDYYVEATDGRGNVRRSPIQHVYVGPGVDGGGGGGERVWWTPNPARAGQPVLLEYDASRGPINGAAAIFAHIGFNGWQIVQPADSPMTFDARSGRWELVINVPLSVTAIDVAFNDGQGHWDNNTGADWHVVVEGAQPPWVMDGQLDAGAQLVAQNGALSLYAGVRGSLLYVAAPDAGEGQDHFVFLARPPGTMRAAPWAKAGGVAGWAAYLADENNNDYEAWYDLNPGVFGQAVTGPNGGVLEGVIDIEQEFGTRPAQVWLAFGAYQTADGGALVPERQVPASRDNDGNLEADEYALFVIVRPGDANCDGFVNNFDIDPFVLALSDPAAYAAAYPNCDIRTADVNGDGVVNNFDIDAFVALLTGG